MTNEFYRCDWYNVFHLSHECSTTMLVFLMFSHSYAGNLDSTGLGVVGEALTYLNILGTNTTLFFFLLLGLKSQKSVSAQIYLS